MAKYRLGLHVRYLLRLITVITVALMPTISMAESRDTRVVEPKQDEERIGGMGGTGLYRSKANPKPEIERLDRPERLERPEKPELDDDFRFNRPGTIPNDSLERPDKEK